MRAGSHRIRTLIGACQPHAPNRLHTLRNRGDAESLIHMLVLDPQAIAFDAPDELRTAVILANEVRSLVCRKAELLNVFSGEKQVAAVHRLVPKVHSRKPIQWSRRLFHEHVRPRREIGIYIIDVPHHSRAVLGFAIELPSCRRLPADAYDNDGDSSLVARKVGTFEGRVCERNVVTCGEHQRPKNRDLLALADGQVEPR